MRYGMEEEDRQERFWISSRALWAEDTEFSGAQHWQQLLDIARLVVPAHSLWAEGWGFLYKQV
jgi:hypothetical protein